MRFFVPKKGRINRDYGNTLLEESSIPLASADDKRFLLSPKIERPIFQVRFYQIIVFIVLSTGILLGRTLYLSVVKGASYQETYSALHNQTEWILAPRGLITDRNKETLAYNAPGRNEREFSRQYPDGSFFSHIIGYIGRADSRALANNPSYLPFDLVGKAGIERQYEKYLRGIYGRIDKPVNAEGDMRRNVLTTQAQAGNTVVLSIDVKVQKALTHFLEEGIKETGSPGGAAILLDPRNGKIISLVATPRYDNNVVSPDIFKDLSHPLFNRAIAGEYPPGSAIKPFIASAVLNEHAISPTATIDDRGQITIPSLFDPKITWIFHSWKALGPVDMRRALALSSNIYFFTVGGGYKDTKGIGIDKIADYLRKFGFGKPSAIDLPSAAAGFIPSPAWKKETFGSDWFIGDTYNTSIGQGFLRVTPLQLALATSAIANGGTIYVPQLLERVEDDKGHVLHSSPLQIANNIGISSQDLAIIREGMRMAVTEGTVRRLSSLPHAVAGKTGSAEAGKDRKAHGWITLFAPYENPEIVLTILVENGGGGERAAVPVAKKFLEWYWREYIDVYLSPIS